jgi:NAD(P)-dependent dehydrogenase (short-subunit alcohol dehydrogenase family)
MQRPLENQFALVTGASKGVGKGIALELARQGCAVAVNYHRDRKSTRLNSSHP